MDFFMHSCWNFEKIGEEGNRHRYRVKGSTEAGTIIDFLYEPDRRQGSWTIAEGIIHHGAFAVPDMDVQARIKFETEGVGFTDFSDRKNRGYFESTYVRTPGGVMRSEEHTSETQSLMRISYAVFCLKKKKNTSIHNNLSITTYIYKSQSLQHT